MVRCVPRKEPIHPVEPALILAPQPASEPLQPNTPVEPPLPYCVCGPPAAIVGWVPYYKSIIDMQANAYTRHKYSWPAFNVVFDSGNQPSPLAFSGQTDFEKLVDSQDFRSALSIRDVKLCCDSEGNPQSVAYIPYVEVGYTPLRTEINWPIFGDTKLTFWHSKGVGSTLSKVTWQDNCATISCWDYFKIGGIGNLGSWILTGQWAPFAWIQLDYTICCNGSVTVKFYGSDIPSQYYNIDWGRVGLHDMLADTTNQIEGFLNAGDCKAAPGGLKYTWTGKAVPRK